MIQDNPSPTQFERRRAPRRTLDAAVTLRSPAGMFATTAGRAKNVSANGIYLVQQFNVAVGDSVELLFDLPTPTGDYSYPVLCTGRTVRVDSEAGQFGLAVAFDRVEIIGTA